MQLDFFYDLSSPWTYLAFNNIQPIIEETGATVRWRPFLVGGVFNAVNPGVYEARAVPTDPKVIHNFRWLHEWARLAGIPLVFPTEHHPVKSILAMRVCCVLEPQQQALRLFSAAAFDAYFAEGNNIDDPAVLARVADSCGLDGNNLVEQASEQSIKDQLRANTEAAIALGAYGSPSVFIADKLYFGNDQLPLVRATLLRGDTGASSSSSSREGQ